MGEQISFHSSLTIEGYWWLPENPEKQVAGTLTFDQNEGAHLQLLGLFGGVESFNSNPNESRTIFGISKKGQQITLLKAFNVQRQMNMPGIFNERYFAHFLCIGHHFTSATEAIFSKCYFRFDRLEEWIGARPFDFEWSDGSSSMALNINRVKTEELTSFGDLKIGKSSNLHTNANGLTEYTVTSQSFLTVETDSPATLDRLFSEANKVQELAALCTGHYLPLTHLKVTVHGSGDERRPPTDVDICTQMQHPEAGSRPKHEHPLFAANELLAANPDAIEKWFDQYEILTPAINLFFALTGEKKLYLNLRFLLAVQAIEVFHRRTVSATLMEKSEFKKLRDKLVDALPDDLTDRMKEKLSSLYNFANEPSLKQRLDDIISNLNAEFGEEIAGVKPPFSRSVVDTRNYNTHFTKKLEKKALNPDGMHWATRRLVMVLTYLFLRQIGIGADAFKQALERHREFQALFASDKRPF